MVVSRACAACVIVVGLAACLGRTIDDAREAPAPAPPADGGGESDADASNDGAVFDGTFCEAHPDALFCEDFERDAFPPPEWAPDTRDGGTLAVTTGFASSRALSAAHDPSSEPTGAFLHREEKELVNIDISFRVKLVELGDPPVPLQVFWWGPTALFFEILAPDAALVETRMIGGAPVYISLPFTANEWHQIAIELVYEAFAWSIRVRYDGALVNTEPVLVQRVGLARDSMVALGARSLVDGGAGKRRVEIDDFLVASRQR